MGWWILAYRYNHDNPELQPRASREILLDNMRKRFVEPEREFSENENLTLTHAKDGFEVKVEVHALDLTIEYTDAGMQSETYLCMLSSDAITWSERVHKQLFRDVFNTLPWNEKAGGWVDDKTFKVVWSTGIEERGFDPFDVTPKRWQECPILDKYELPRRRLLRLKPATTYLGTRINSR